VSRALDWPTDYLLCVLSASRYPTPTAAPSAPTVDPFTALVDGQAEILAVLRRIEAHIEDIARGLTPA